MDSKIRDLVKSLGITVVYDGTLEKDAYYMPKFDIVVVNNNLSEFDQKKALLHELKHAASHKNEIELYNIAFSLHSKMEYQAECFMVVELLDDYIQKTGLEPSQVNRITFLESCNIDTRFENFVHNRLSQYMNRLGFV